jgi:hypothetical protein
MHLFIIQFSRPQPPVTSNILSTVPQFLDALNLEYMAQHPRLKYSFYGGIPGT